MKRMGLFLALTTVVVLGIATIVSAGITIDMSGPGAAPGDSIYTGAEVRFDIRVTNNSGEEYANAQTRLIVGKVHLLDEIAALAFV